MDANLSLKELQKAEILCLDLEKSEHSHLKKKVVKNDLKGFSFIDINYLKKLIDFVEKKSSSRVVGINSTLFFNKQNPKTKMFLIAYSNKNKVRYAVLAGYFCEWGKQDLKMGKR